MTCKMCSRTQADGFRPPCPGIEAVRECPTKEVPYLARGNRGFLFLFRRMEPFIAGGFGDFKDTAVRFIFDTYHIPAEQRPIYLDKVVTTISAIKEVQEKEGAKTEKTN